MTQKVTLKVERINIDTKKIAQLIELRGFIKTEREGFEPPEPCSSTVFKTAAIDHSAISPLLNFYVENLNKLILSYLNSLCRQYLITISTMGPVGIEPTTKRL